MSFGKVYMRKSINTNKIKDDTVLTDIESHKAIVLNDSATQIWQDLVSGCESIDELVSRHTKRHSVELEKGTIQVIRFLNLMYDSFFVDFDLTYDVNKEDCSTPLVDIAELSEKGNINELARIIQEYKERLAIDQQIRVAGNGFGRTRGGCKTVCANP